MELEKIMNELKSKYTKNAPKICPTCGAPMKKKGNLAGLWCEGDPSHMRELNVIEKEW